MERLQQLIGNAEKHRKLMEDAHDYIWEHAESGFREWETSAYLAQRFEALGYTLTHAGNIPGFYTDLDTGRPGPKVLILGVAYKSDIDDYRESPAIHVIEEFKRFGSEVSFYDPYIASFREKGEEMVGLTEISPEILAGFDLVCITTGHTNVDYDMVCNAGVPVFDCRNITKNVKNRENIELL